MMNTEHKQNINLSNYARTIIKEDLDTFAPGQSFNGFLNEIIEKYCEFADASIHTALERQRSQLQSALDEDSLLAVTLNDTQIDHIVHLLDRHTEAALTNNVTSYNRDGASFSFHLNTGNYERFFPEDGKIPPDIVYYGGYYSRYFKAVVEEYCSLSRFQRESIYFRDYIETIQYAIEMEKKLRLEMTSPFSKNTKETWDVRAYAVMPDTFHLYHYLVGKSVQARGLRRDEKIASIRLSNIKKLSILNNKTSRSGALSAAEKKEIRQKIQKNSVSFLIGDEQEVIVRFNENGKKTYDNTLFMRPPLTRVNNGIYHFLCTPLQAKQYFIRFGADAEVLAPEELRREFAEMYREAARLYAPTQKIKS